MSIPLSDCLKQQRQEALGPVNKWYCSQFFGYEVIDPEILLAYYIKHGGASNYRRELAAGNGPANSSTTQPKG